jgi:hypothetical protein
VDLVVPLDPAARPADALRAPLLLRSGLALPPPPAAPAPAPAPANPRSLIVPIRVPAAGPAAAAAAAAAAAELPAALEAVGRLLAMDEAALRRLAGPVPAAGNPAAAAAGRPERGDVLDWGEAAVAADAAALVEMLAGGGGSDSDEERRRGWGAGLGLVEAALEAMREHQVMGRAGPGRAGPGREWVR